MGAVEPAAFQQWGLVSSAIRACGVGNTAFAVPEPVEDSDEVAGQGDIF
jgi:hypothetical protein